MTRAFGAGTAKRVTEGHESGKDYPPNERKMDEQNNAIGRDVAGQKGSCTDNVLHAYHAGSLALVPPGQSHNDLPLVP